MTNKRPVKSDSVAGAGVIRLTKESSHSVRSWSLAVAAVGSMFIVGCAQTHSPIDPSSTAGSASTAVPPSVGVPFSATDVPGAAHVSGQPEYELAYYDGTIVT